MIIGAVIAFALVAGGCFIGAARIRRESIRISESADALEQQLLRARQDLEAARVQAMSRRTLIGR